eukprot:1104529-Prymnesium_polylepis.2
MLRLRRRRQRRQRRRHRQGYSVRDGEGRHARWRGHGHRNLHRHGLRDGRAGCEQRERLEVLRLRRQQPVAHQRARRREGRGPQRDARARVSHRRCDRRSLGHRGSLRRRRLGRAAGRGAHGPGRCHRRGRIVGRRQSRRQRRWQRGSRHWGPHGGHGPQRFRRGQRNLREQPVGGVVGGVARTLDRKPLRRRRRQVARQERAHLLPLQQVGRHRRRRCHVRRR